MKREGGREGEREREREREKERERGGERWGEREREREVLYAAQQVMVSMILIACLSSLTSAAISYPTNSHTWDV